MAPRVFTLDKSFSALLCELSEAFYLCREQASAREQNRVSSRYVSPTVSSKILRILESKSSEGRDFLFTWMLSEHVHEVKERAKNVRL